MVTWGRKEQSKCPIALKTWFHDKAVAFSDSSLPKVSGLLPPFPQLDNLASIIFVPTAAFPYLPAKPNYKLTPKKGGKKIVFWWFSWTGWPYRDVPEWAVCDWQDLAVVCERGSREMFISFHYWWVVNWIKFAHETIFSWLSEEWEMEKCELETFNHWFIVHIIHQWYTNICSLIPTARKEHSEKDLSLLNKCLWNVSSISNDFSTAW